MAVVPGTAGNIPEQKIVSELPKAPAYRNTAAEIQMRRIMQMDKPAAIASQYMHDRGMYERAAVGPVEYSEGNIKKSKEITGLAGYNHRDGMPIPDSPDDMNQAEYLASVGEQTPAVRMALQNIVGRKLKQNFLDTSSAFLPQEYPSPMLNMQNNLLTRATIIKNSKKK